MNRRTQDALGSLLAWAGYGLGYSEEEARPVVERTARGPRPEESLHATRWPPTQGETGREPAVPAAVADHRLRVGRNVPAEANGNGRDPHWTELFTTDTDRRLRVWHELEEGLVERWNLWMGPRLASVARRRRSWAEDLRACAEDAQATIERRQAQWHELRQNWNSRWSAWVPGRRESRTERQTCAEETEAPIQRDRISKLLQRVSLDKSPPAVVAGRSTVCDRSADQRTEGVFADVWSITDPTPVDTDGEAEEEACGWRIRRNP